MTAKYESGLRVGVYLGNTPPWIGGGHTFVAEVFRALADQAGESRHRFFHIGFEANAPARAPNQNSLSFISLHRDPRFTERIFARVKAAFDQVRNGGQLEFQCPSWEELARRDQALAKRVAEDVDIVWCLNPFFYLTADVPFIATVFDLQHRLQPFFPEVSSNGQWLWRERIFGYYLRRAALVITPNQVGRDELQRFYQIAPERIRLLHHPAPCPLPGGSTEIRDKSVLSRHALDPGYLFYPAQLWPHKNHVVLLEALRWLRDSRGVRLRIVLTGSDGGNWNYVREVVSRLKLDDQVSMLGFIPEDELATIYRGALALVYPSLFGPENLPPLEAFAFGCPVVAARVAGAEEQFGESALLVDSANPEAWGEAMVRIATDASLRETLMARGRQQAQNWTARDFVGEVFRFLDEFEPLRSTWVRAQGTR